jgi:hypothetical protein
MVLVRKNLSVSRGERCLFDEIVYFFCITNVVLMPAPEIVSRSLDAPIRHGAESILQKERKPMKERESEHQRLAPDE